MYVCMYVCTFMIVMKCISSFVLDFISIFLSNNCVFVLQMTRGSSHLVINTFHSSSYHHLRANRSSYHRLFANSS